MSTAADSPTAKGPTYNVAIVHPILCYGGAEFFVVDLARGLRKKHRVNIDLWTTFNQGNFGSDSRKDDFIIREHANWLPRLIFYRFNLFCIHLRLLCLFVVMLYEHIFRGKRYDAIIFDQTALVAALYRLICSKVIYYCHFPIAALTRKTQSRLIKAYRQIHYWPESVSSQYATDVLTNSHYTAENVYKIMTRIKQGSVKVVYPCLDFAAMVSEVPPLDVVEKKLSQVHPRLRPRKYFLCFNRFAAEHRSDRALKAFVLYKRAHPDSEMLLVVAGGFDDTNLDNINYYNSLTALAKELQLDTQEEVVFLLNVAHKLRVALLAYAECVLYPSSNEPFGLVPVEACYLGSIVACCSSGGPLEVIVPNVTGFLCPDDNEELVPASFAKVLDTVVTMTDQEKNAMRAKALEHVQSHFNHETTIETIYNLIKSHS